MPGARRTIVASLFLVFLLLNLHYLRHQRPKCQHSTLHDQRSQLWQQLHPLLARYAPQCPAPILRGSAGAVRFDSVTPIPREDYIENRNEIELPMQTAHDGFVQSLHTLNSPRAFISGTKGIVTAAGGTYLPTLVVTLHLLRRTNSTLPVEVFLQDDSEYEAEICERVLPALNANCILLSSITNTNTTRIKGYQLKAFAILFSTFETLLWLDADNIPLHDPALLLTSAPFTTTGLVTWPDFWTNTAAGIYFTISRQPTPESTSRASTEAGTLLLSKRTHLPTLLLAAYYNFHGPEYYYPLLNQGAPGAGDKDTFLHAATALDLPFYAVRTPPVDIGRMNTAAKATAALNAGFVQVDPGEDFAVHRMGPDGRKGAGLGLTPRAFFIHAGAPEFNPGKELLGRKLRGLDGRPARLWTYPPMALESIGFDAERVVWEETVSVACAYEGLFVSWRNNTGLCEGVRAHWRAVFKGDDVVVGG